MCFESISPVILKSLWLFVFMKTGVASESLTISGYETQYGEGINTSSPLSRVA